MDIRLIAASKGLSVSELGKIGGMKKKRKVPKIMPNKLCKPGCELWSVCFAKTLSLTRFNGSCGLANLSERAKNIVIQVFQGKSGIDGLILELMGQLVAEAYGRENLEDRMKTLALLLKTRELLYPEKKQMYAEIVEYPVSKELLEKYEEIMNKWMEWKKMEKSG